MKSASTSAKWQFVGTVDQGENGGFMLNTDFALFYDLKGFMKSKVLKLGKKCGMKNNLIEYTSDSIVVLLDFCSLIYYVVYHVLKHISHDTKYVVCYIV